MSIDANMLIKTFEGEYTQAAFEDIVQVFINTNGEKMVFFKGIQVDTKEIEYEQRKTRSW